MFTIQHAAHCMALQPVCKVTWWVYLARGDMSHWASPIIWGGTLGVHLPSIVELSMILRLLILGCWRIATSLHGLIAILRLSPKLLLPIGLLPIGLLIII